MILLSRHKVERTEKFRFVKECVSILPMIAKQSMASQQMRAAPGEPRRGVIPVELVSSQSSDNFPFMRPLGALAGVSGTNRRYLLLYEEGGLECQEK